MGSGEEDLLEELAYSEAEGPADMADGMEADMFGESDFEADMGESDFEADMGESDFEADMGEDGFGYFEEGEGEDGAEEAEEFLGQALGAILGAEEEDEFLGKLFKGAKKLIQKAAPVVGQIARGAAPILSMIPHPAAQVGAQVANVLGELRAEGASAEDALEAVTEIAVRDRRALPIVAGLAARSVLKNQAATLPPVQRQQAVKAMTRAAKTLIARGGPKAIRALPKIARSVRRTTAGNGTPIAVRPKVVARTATKVARNPNLLRRLSNPSPKARQLVQRFGTMLGGYGGQGGHRGYGGRRGYSSYGGQGSYGGRTISIPGPATITIHVG